MSTHNGKLHLTFEKRRYKTRLINSFQQPPLRASHVLYLDDSNRASVYLVETSGGLVSGDHNDFQITVKNNSSVCLIPQSATKVYPAKTNQWSKQTIHITIEENGSLEWKPESLIPFESSLFKGHTIVQMTSTSTLLFTEILASGREKSGETFQYEQLQTFMEIWVDDICAVYDCFNVQPKRDNVQQLGVLEEYSYMGSLWFISASAHLLSIENVNEQLHQDESIRVGVTKIDNHGILIRWLTSDLCLLKKEMEKMMEGITRLDSSRSM